THRRFGTVSFRAQQVASGALAPREGEDAVDLGTVEKIIREAELPDMIARRDEFIVLRDALQSIQRTWLTHADGAPIDLGKIVELVGRIVGFLDDAVRSRDPSAGLAPAKSETSGAEGEDSAASGQRIVVGKIGST